MPTFYFRLTILLLAIGLFSCSNEIEMVELPEDLTVYQVDHNLVASVNLDDIIEDYSFIGLNLPDNLQFAGIQKVAIHNDVIYILDMIPGGERARILAFDIDGEFLYLINRPGRGPGEYEYVYDFTLTDDYLIMSTSNRIIFNHIEDGSHSHSITNRFDDNWVQWIYFFDNETGVTDAGRGRANQSMHHIHFFETENQTVFQEEVPFPSHAVMMGHSYHNLFKTPNGLHARPVNSRIVYSINQVDNREFDVSKAYAFDFGDLFVTENFLRTSFRNMNEIFTERIDKEFVHHFDVFETETNLFMSYLYQDQRFVYLHDFMSDKHLNIEHIESNTLGISLNPSTTWNNYIVSLVYPWTFGNTEEIHPDLAELLEKSNDEGHPTLVLARFSVN